MSIYKLYVKIHNKTGMKYLGYTAKDDLHKYTGSGFHWRKHLRKHGKYYDTIIFLETTDLAQIRAKGILYSNAWDVVKSPFWANEKPESGPGVIPTKEMIYKQLATKKKNGTMNANSSESTAKANRTKRLNGTAKLGAQKAVETKRRNGNINSNTPETLAKSKASKQKRGVVDGKNPEVGCIYCHRIISFGNWRRWHGDQCLLKR